jgi:hypothetical protein
LGGGVGGGGADRIRYPLSVIRDGPRLCVLASYLFHVGDLK